MSDPRLVRGSRCAISCLEGRQLRVYRSCERVISLVLRAKRADGGQLTILGDLVAWVHPPEDISSNALYYTIGLGTHSVIA